MFLLAASSKGKSIYLRDPPVSLGVGYLHQGYFEVSQVSPKVSSCIDVPFVRVSFGRSAMLVCRHNRAKGKLLVGHGRDSLDKNSYR